MSNAGAIRAGKTFVEITADDSKFQATVKRVHNRMAALSQTLRQTGTTLALGGAAIGLPMVLAAKKAAEFENALLELKGSVSDLSPKQLKAVRDESIRMSKAMGVAPAKIAQSFALLVKAGMSVEEAMGGAARSAVEFGRVSGVEAQQAATFMKVAMNVFGVSAEQAVDTLSAAADASETDIAHMVEAFGLVGSAGKTFDQSLFGVAQGFAALARYGIQGEEAGTGIKVLLSRLVAPSQEAEKALGKLGLSVASFRDADGKLLPMVQIVGLLSDAMKNMSTDARQAIMADKALVDVFGDRGIKVIGAFADMGVQGFDRLAKEMEGQRTVANKFLIMMEGISGSFERMQSAVERLAVAFGAGLSPSLVVASHAIAVVVDLLSWLLNGIPVLSPILATLTATAVGLGVAMVSVGWALTAVNFGIRGFLKAGPAFATVASVMSRAAVGLTASLTALRAAFFALPLVGQIAAVLAGGTALAAGAWWMMSGGSKPNNAEPKKTGGIKRDEFRKALEEPMAHAEQKAARGDTLATFADSIAGQLGIGPKLNAEAKIADATGRTADGVEQLVAMGRNDGSDSAQRSPPAGKPTEKPKTSVAAASRPQVVERVTETSSQVVIDRQPAPTPERTPAVMPSQPPVESQAVVAIPSEAVAKQKEQRPPVAKRAEAAPSVEVAVAAQPQLAMPEPAPRREPVVQVVANEPKRKPVQPSPAQPSVEAVVPPQPLAVVQVDAQPAIPSQREQKVEPAALPVFARSEQPKNNPSVAPIAPAPQIVANEPKPKPVQPSPAQPSVEAVVPPQPPAIVQVAAQPAMPAQREQNVEPAALPVFARSEQPKNNPSVAPIAPAPQIVAIERASPMPVQSKQPIETSAPIVQAVAAVDPATIKPVVQADVSIPPLETPRAPAIRPIVEANLPPQKPPIVQAVEQKIAPVQNAPKIETPAPSVFVHNHQSLEPQPLRLPAHDNGKNENTLPPAIAVSEPQPIAVVEKINPTLPNSAKEKPRHAPLVQAVKDSPPPATPQIVVQSPPVAETLNRVPVAAQAAASVAPVEMPAIPQPAQEIKAAPPQPVIVQKLVEHKPRAPLPPPPASEPSRPVSRPDYGNVGPLQMAERFKERPRPASISQLPAATTMPLGLDFAKIVDATRRTADAVERLVAPPQSASDKARSVPSPASLASGLTRPSPVVGGVTASLERDLVSVAERTAIATEKAVGILREILNTQPSGGMAFA